MKGISRFKTAVLSLDCLMQSRRHASSKFNSGFAEFSIVAPKFGLLIVVSRRLFKLRKELFGCVVHDLNKFKKNECMA